MGNKNCSGINIYCRFIAAIILVAGPVAGCGDRPDASKSGSTEAIVVRVNNAKVTVENFIHLLRLEEKKFRLEGKDSLNEEALLWLKNQVLSQLVQRELFMQEALKHKIDVLDEEYKKALSDIRSGYQKDQFQRILEIEEINEIEWNKKLKNNLIIKKLIRKVVHSRITVSEGELKKYYDGHLEEFNKTERIRALQIMVDTEAEARDILRKLKNDPNLFSYLARKFSQGLEAKKGGDLGFLDVGQMPEEFESVFLLKVDEVSDVIQTPYGYHIFQVREKVPKRKMSFEESKLIIEKKLIQENQDKAFSKWFLKLKQEADIEVDYEVLAEIS
jgi:parvulin-like peptidyl-prolyl isomerase